MKTPLLIKIGGCGCLLDTKLLTLTEVVVVSTLLAVVLGVITVWGLDVVDAGVDEEVLCAQFRTIATLNKSTSQRDPPSQEGNEAPKREG